MTGASHPPLRGEGGVLLLSTYELGHQPFSPALAMALLQEAGFRPVAIDASLDPVPADAIRRSGLVMCWVPMLTALRLAVPLLATIRDLNPSAHVCLTGLYAGLNQEWLLGLGASSIALGECEPLLVELAQALDQEQPLPAGLGRQGHPAVPLRQRLSHWPVPNRTRLPAPDRYARLILASGEARVTGYTEASRGCLHTCLHCPVVPVYRGRFVAVPRDTVLADIRQQVEAGARHITFGDPDFLNGPGHALRILEAMHAEFPDLTFDITTRIEHLLERRSLLPRLRDLGCAFVVSAVESLNDAVLAALDKGHTRADIFQAAALMKATGLPLRMTFVPFTPWTSLEDYRDLCDTLLREGWAAGVDPVQLGIRLLIPPGSALLDAPGPRPWLQDLDEEALTWRWVHPDPRMDALQEEVAALVEARAGDDPLSVIRAVRELAWGVDGSTPPGIPERCCPAPVPRLSESWFCCAEPTAAQRAGVTVLG